MTKLNQLAPKEGSTPNKTRVGRGIGSGKGKTCGRGIKGQKARSGVAINGFEGGQMPIYRRLPKRGFNNYNSKNIATITLAQIESFVAAKKLVKTISIKELQALGVMSKTDDGIKILASGEIKVKVTIEATAASKGATAAIEKAGGKITLIDASTLKKAESKKDAPKIKDAK